MPILHPMHWIANSIIDTLKNHIKMHDHLPFQGKYFVHLLQNMQQWCGMVYELNPTFFDFNGDFLHYVTHLNKCFFHGGEWTWKLVMILFFFDIGGGIIRCHKSKHINNPFSCLYMASYMMANYGHAHVCF